MPSPPISDLVAGIRRACAQTGPVSLMEICGTHTVSLFRSGVRSLLPSSLRLVSGPGCPVCVTAQGYVDAACSLAGMDGVTVCTYGDMVRVPGRQGSLADHRARGARVQVVYSVRDALRLATEHPERRHVFLAVGFETTAPTTALALEEAAARGVDNFLVLTGHKRVIPAMLALLASGDAGVDGFICPGHVSVVIGADAYAPIVERHRKPCVVTGFEPEQMLEGILNLVTQIADRQARVDNVYGAAVRPAGNPIALACLDRVFIPAPAVWRALGTIPESGLDLREGYARFDAARVFGVDTSEDYEPAGCRCGEVIQGLAEPHDCALFGAGCTPLDPVGPCMVSSEGTCAAWYKYGPPKP